MARTKGMLNLSGNLEVNAGAPLDARTVVPTVADLTNASNFQYKYIGMTVVVQATGDMYILTANDVTVAANWKQVGSGGGSSYTAGDGISISNDEISVKAGSNLSFDSSGNLNATDTTYTAGDGIVIDNDEISTDNMPAADMSEIVTPLPSVMSRLPRYSTEEQMVGYWIDGKPLYQLTVIGTTPSTVGTQVTIADNLATNVNEVVGINSLFSYTGEGDIKAYWLPMVGINNGMNNIIKIMPFVTNSETLNLSFYNTYTAWANRSYICIIQYTKTTD